MSSITVVSNDTPVKLQQRSGLEGLAAREAQVATPKQVRVCRQCRGSKFVKVPGAGPYPLTVACSCTVAPDSVEYVTVSVH